jgi:hypothetical protein
MTQYEDDDRRVHDEMEAEGRDHCEHTQDTQDLKAAVAKHATMIADNKRLMERMISLIEDLAKIVEHQKECINRHNADIIALQIKTD